MYADAGPAFRFMQGCSPEIHQFEDLFKPYKLSDQTVRLIAFDLGLSSKGWVLLGRWVCDNGNGPFSLYTSCGLRTISLVEACEYGFGEESGLFKAPEPIIIEEPMLAVDPLSQEIVELSDLGSLQSDQQLIEKAFYDCEQDLLVKSAMESPLLSDVVDTKNVSLVAEMDSAVKSSGVVVSDVPVPKSVSSGNLRSMDMPQHEDAVIRRLFPPVDNGMRRAFSESDIQALGTRNTGLVQSQLDRIIVSCTSEDRREKLSRYRDKKSRRNFGRKIKYACRKALADSQPRIRGRFAKTEEMQK
ncbi:hypothetical protein Bca4012_054411 [Brassica carinata]